MRAIALILLAVAVGISCGSCRNAPVAPQCVPTHDTVYYRGDTAIFQLARKCP